MATLKTINKILTQPLVLLLLGYQKTLSPDHSWVRAYYPYGFCKFYPSCSMYARTTLQTQGLIGIIQIIKRLLSCNPLSAGGINHP